VIIYLCAYPIYNFILPLYAFWKQDDFGWGTTRVVILLAGAEVAAAAREIIGHGVVIPALKWDTAWVEGSSDG
jgi:chitin synthase